MSTAENKLKTGYMKTIHSFETLTNISNSYKDVAFKTGVNPFAQTGCFSLTKSHYIVIFIKGHGHSCVGHLPAMFSKVSVAGALLLESHS